MPVVPHNDEEFTLDELVAIHGLSEQNANRQFAIEGIALDLGLTNEETITLLKEHGYLPKPQINTPPTGYHPNIQYAHAARCITNRYM